MTERVQSIERGIDILNALASGQKTVTEVARATCLSKGTAFRLLASLNYQNLVMKDPIENVYSLGPGFLRLVDGATRGLSVVTSLARPALARLRDLTGETIALHVRLGAERICIGELTSLQPIRYSASAGTLAPVHVGAAGRVLLAFMPEADLARLLPSLSLRPITDSSVTNLAILKRELAIVRRQGYACSVGERTPGAAAITVPVYGPQGLIIALSILGPASRLPRAAQLGFLEFLKGASTEIGEALSLTVGGRLPESPQ
jgi:DNA-binding IclR family transcriptional regulator